VCLLVGLVVAAVAVVALAGNRETTFFEDIADLPLAPGLIEDRDQSLVFDKPDGRIVEAVASGAVTGQQAIAFYQGVLPALGWQAAGRTELHGNVELIFERDDERIRIVVEEREGRSTLRLELSPK